MNIYFDFELEPEYENIVQTPYSKALSDEIRNVVAERVFVLKDLIEKEEDILLENDSNAAIVIRMLENPVMVVSLNYSNELSSKIHESMQDISHYINLRLQKVDGSFNN